MGDMFSRSPLEKLEQKIDAHPTARRFKRHWLTIAFFLGFIVDNLTLNSVEQVFDNVVLAGYVLLAGASLMVLYASAAQKLPPEYLARAERWSPILLQFSFGGLLSGILIFYSRSGSFFVSWPFLLLIILVIVGNETLRRRAQRLIFNLAILFVGLFSYVVLIVPVVTGKMGALVFFFSGCIAATVMFFYVRQLRKIIPNFLAANLRMVIFSLSSIFVALNFLYFANVIPPIPLSLKDVGIYHNVETNENKTEYYVTYEKGKWYNFFKDSDKTYHYQSGDGVYCYASVFAPTRLSTEIFHRWEYYSEEDKEWRTHGDRLSYPISGGRGDGYRGFTVIRNVRDGTWRCTVETERKQVLGREKFKIETRFHDELVTETR